MKTLSVISAIVASAALTSASAQTIAQWTFETSVPTTAGPHAAEFGTGSALASHAGAAVYSNPVGNGSAESFSANTWAVGDYFQFSLSTVGYQGIGLSWDQASSSTGPGEFKLAYQVNGGGFTDYMDYTVLPNQVAAPGLGNWSSSTAILGYSFSVDFSALSVLDNATSVDFRLIMRTTTDSTPPGTVAASGTSRIDNFTVSVVPEPSGLLAIGGLMLLAGRKLAKRS